MVSTPLDTSFRDHVSPICVDLETMRAISRSNWDSLNVNDIRAIGSTSIGANKQIQKRITGIYRKIEKDTPR